MFVCVACCVQEEERFVVKGVGVSFFSASRLTSQSR